MVLAHLTDYATAKWRWVSRLNANENETGDWIEIPRTIDSAAFVERNVGLGFSSFGAGGGGAAVCGAEASGDIDGRLGTTVGGEFGRAGDVL